MKSYIFKIEKSYNSDFNTYEEAKKRFWEELEGGEFEREDIEEVEE